MITYDVIRYFGLSFTQNGELWNQSTKDNDPQEVIVENIRESIRQQREKEQQEKQKEQQQQKMKQQKKGKEQQVKQMEQEKDKDKEQDKEVDYKQQLIQLKLKFDEEDKVDEDQTINCLDSVDQEGYLYEQRLDLLDKREKQFSRVLTYIHDYETNLQPSSQQSSSSLQQFSQSKQTSFFSITSKYPENLFQFSASTEKFRGVLNQMHFLERERNFDRKEDKKVIEEKEKVKLVANANQEKEDYEENDEEEEEEKEEKEEEEDDDDEQGMIKDEEKYEKKK
ncbi:MAG: hypothetical protein EZS28_020341 [Streblomastix strix]|uniref:Uncharacterized protein n=1 Tax=Streblomastix strix TaxID=222440 RepID=A0A5J4VNM3_9EUKA|nr:MAG: hypothetical protein EZS28_020341 [Streblomastix strix]